MRMIKLLLVAWLACTVYGQTTVGSTTGAASSTQDNSSAGITKPIKSGTSLPATCGVGEFYFKTNATLGQQVYACTSTNTWTLQGDGGGGAAFDPNDSTQFWFLEEFCGGNTTSGQMGQNNYKLSAMASGTFAYQNVGTLSATAHPCILRISSSGAGVNSGGGLALSNSSSTANINSDDATSLTWDFRMIARINSITDARFRFGLMTGETSIAPTSGMFIRYDTLATTFDDDLKNGGAGTWVAQTCTTSACGTDTGGTTVQFATAPTTGWHRFRIYRSGTTIYMQIDNGTAKTFCASGCDATVSAPANIGWSPVVMFASETSAAVTADVDRMSGSITGITRF